MPRNMAHFGVSPRLAVLLGESYRTVELALKELVDNAWDANALTVEVHLPAAMAPDAKIIISDNGEGMTEKQVREDYLRIARDRRKDRGARTPPPLSREVKGRKGVGKFAGIIVAEVMDIETKQKGTISRFRIDRKTLEETPGDIVRIEVPIETTSCGLDETGTRSRFRISHRASIFRRLNPFATRSRLTTRVKSALRSRSTAIGSITFRSRATKPFRPFRLAT